MKKSKSMKASSKLILGTAILLVFIGFSVRGQDKISISTFPEDIYALNTDYEKLINVDLYIENKTNGILNVSEFKIKVFDKNDKLIISKRLSHEGVSPGILTIPNRTVNAAKTLLIFNPFYSFSKDIPIDHIKFEIILTDVWTKTFVESVTIPVKEYQQTISHSLPLKGLSFIADGNDYYSHHRRFDFTHIAAKILAMDEQSNRYGYDFQTVKEDGQLYKNDGKELSDWYCFGQNVYATAAGTVVDAVDGAVDPRIGTLAFNYQTDVPGNVKIMGGNYIVIQHQDNTFSQFFHLKKGSVQVAIGDKVKKGQLIAQVGNSGDSFKPHLHYQISDSKNLFNSAGLPVYFSDYYKVMGSTSVKVKNNGYIETGEFVKND